MRDPLEIERSNRYGMRASVRRKDADPRRSEGLLRERLRRIRRAFRANSALRRSLPAHGVVTSLASLSEGDRIMSMPRIALAFAISYVVVDAGIAHAADDVAKAPTAADVHRFVEQMNADYKARYVEPNA